MTENQELLLKLIKEGKTCNDISKELNISNKQLYNRLLTLKNNGIMLERKYYSNGQMTYKSIHSSSIIHNRFGEISNGILSLHEENDIKMLVISDLHFGNKLERLDLVDNAFNYCAKNGINIILCAGDMIDSLPGRCKEEYNTLEKQIKHFVKDYPHDKNILTFAVGGNHDIYALYKEARSIIDYINNYRHDIIISDFLLNTVNIKNESINLYHHIDNYGKKNSDAIITLHGHAHKYMAYINQNNKLQVVVPSLSDINETLPTALEMNLHFKKGFIETVDLKQIYFIYRDMVLSETSYNLMKNRNVVFKPIDNEICMNNQKIRQKVYSLTK